MTKKWSEPHTRLQALWALEGYEWSIYGRDQLSNLALQALEDPHPRIRSAAIRILEPEIIRNDEALLGRLEQLAGTEDAPYVQLQLLATLGESDSERALELMAELLDKHGDSPYFQELALTGVYQREERLAAILKISYGWEEVPGDDHRQVLTSLADAGAAQRDPDLGHLSETQRGRFDTGSRRYQLCMVCHGENGRGMEGVGPPLAGSEWVRGDAEALVRITLQGFEGGLANATITFTASCRRMDLCPMKILQRS